MILVSHITRDDIINVPADVRQSLAHQRMVPKLPAVLGINPSLVDCGEVEEVLGRV